MDTRVIRLVPIRSLIAAAILSTISCNADEIVEAETPDIVPPESLVGAEALPTIRGAAIGDFALAYGGSGADGSGGAEGVIMTSGLLGDEWINSETFPTRIEIDRRGPIAITNATGEGWFRTISRARNITAIAASRFREFSPDTTRDVGLSEVLSLNGYAYLFFAENYCSGVPFSTANPDGSLVYGDPLTTLAMLDTAEARFDAALAAANALVGAGGVGPATKDRYVYLASLGRARALLGQGQFAAAAAAVAAVPTTFAYMMYHSENTARQNNGVFNANVINERYSVADAEGVNGLPYRSANDPRVPWVRTGGANPDFGFDGITPQFDQRKYLDRRDSIPLATGLEARLIEAEAFLQVGDTVSFLARHNTVRGAPPAYTRVAAPMAALATTGLSSAQVVDLHFRERAFWLYATAHRLWDMRRLARPTAVGGYARGIETVFPTGPYFKQAFTYGTDVNFPIPFDEQNNPNFDQCLDRNP